MTKNLAQIYILIINNVGYKNSSGTPTKRESIPAQKTTNH